MEINVTGLARDMGMRQGVPRHPRSSPPGAGDGAEHADDQDDDATSADPS